MPVTDLIEFDILSAIRRADAAGLVPEQEKAAAPAEKAAFTPSPAVAQAVMAQAQQGAPPGMDPAAAGGGMPPGAAPPGMDPMAAAGGMPPGMDPAAAGAPPGPPPEAGPPPPSPIEDKLDQLIQLMQSQQQAAAGGAAPGGAGGKPATSSVKIDPAHFQQMTHKINVMESILRQLADGMGLQVPAGELFDLHPPAGAAPGPVPAPAAAAPAGGGGGPPPSAIAQQLPPLPPIAAKSSSIADLARIDAGTMVAPVSGQTDTGVTGRSRAAALLAALGRGK